MNMFGKITEVMSGFKWIEKSTADRVVQSGTGEVVGVRLRVTTAKEDRLQGVVTVYEAVMKKMNWVAGDRVRIGIDVEGGRVAVQRCLSGGYALSASPKGGVASKDLIGEAVTSNAKFKVDAENDFAKLVTKSQIVSIDNCILENNTVIVNIKDDL